MSDFSLNNLIHYLYCPLRYHYSNSLYTKNDSVLYHSSVKKAIIAILQNNLPNTDYTAIQALNNEINIQNNAVKCNDLNSSKNNIKRIKECIRKYSKYNITGFSHKITFSLPYAHFTDFIDFTYQYRKKRYGIWIYAGPLTERYRDILRCILYFLNNSADKLYIADTIKIACIEDSSSIQIANKSSYCDAFINDLTAFNKIKKLTPYKNETCSNCSYISMCPAHPVQVNNRDMQFNKSKEIMGIIITALNELNTKTDIHQVISYINRIIQSIYNQENALLLFLKSNRSKQLHLFNKSNSRIPVKKSLINHVFSEQKSIEKGSIIYFPFTARNRKLGVIAINNSNNKINQEDTLYSMIINYAAVTFHNIRTFNLAIRDGLTGCYNKRYLIMMLEDILNISINTKHIFSIILFDLDHFKHYNDTYGHPNGDIILKSLSSRLIDAIGQDGALYRFGGEEFVAVLPYFSIDDAVQKAEECRRAINDLRIETKQFLWRITASIGVAAFPDHGKTIDSLLNAADTALYQAKNNGRNQVVCA